ncbi:MAG: hypothetical protein ACE5EC_02115 [Phycisphaerae bacterium]
MKTPVFQSRNRTIRYQFATAWAPVLLAVAPAIGGTYLYNENDYKPLAPAPVDSIAVYPIDYPFPNEGLVSLAKTRAGLQTNVELLYRRHGRDNQGTLRNLPPYMYPRDLYGYCLYLDIKSMESTVRNKKWIPRVDFGPDPKAIEFYDLKLTGRMDVIGLDKGRKQSIDLLLTLSCPRELTYVRRFRTRFVAPAYQPGDEGAMLPAFKRINRAIGIWLRGQIAALNTSAIRASRREKSRDFITEKWAGDLPKFSRELMNALKTHASPRVVSTWADAYYERWHESGLLYDDVVQVMPSLECKMADAFCYDIFSTWADKYGERDATIARARAAQVVLILLAFGAAAGGAIADQQNNTSGYTQAGAAVALGAIALSAKVEKDLQRDLARIRVDPRFDVSDIVARIERVEGGRYKGFKQRLRNRPDQVVEIVREFYTKDRKPFEEVASLVLNQRRSAIGALGGR